MPGYIDPALTGFAPPAAAPASAGSPAAASSPTTTAAGDPMDAIHALVNYGYQQAGLTSGISADAAGDQGPSGNMDFANGGFVPRSPGPGNGGAGGSGVGGGGVLPRNKAAPNPEDARTQRLAGTSGGGPKTARGASEQQPPTFTDPNAVATSVRTVVPGYRDRANQGGFKKTGKPSVGPRGYARGGLVKGYDDGGPVTDDEPEEAPAEQAFTPPSDPLKELLAPNLNPQEDPSGTALNDVASFVPGSEAAKKQKELSDPEEKMRRIQAGVQAMVQGDEDAVPQVMAAKKVGTEEAGLTPGEANIANIKAAPDIEEAQKRLAGNRNIVLKGSHLSAIAADQGNPDHAADLFNEWGSHLLSGVGPEHNIEAQYDPHGKYLFTSGKGDSVSLTPEQFYGVVTTPHLLDHTLDRGGLWNTLTEASQGEGKPMQPIKKPEAPDLTAKMQSQLPTNQQIQQDAAGLFHKFPIAGGPNAIRAARAAEQSHIASQMNQRDRDAQAIRLEGMKGQTQQAIWGGRNQTQQDIAANKNQTQRDVAAENHQRALDVAGIRKDWETQRIDGRLRQIRLQTEGQIRNQDARNEMGMFNKQLGAYAMSGDTPPPEFTKAYNEAMQRFGLGARGTVAQYMQDIENTQQDIRRRAPQLFQQGQAAPARNTPGGVGQIGQQGPQGQQQSTSNPIRQAKEGQLVPFQGHTYVIRNGVLAEPTAAELKQAQPQ